MYVQEKETLERITYSSGDVTVCQFWLMYALHLQVKKKLFIYKLAFEQDV